MKKALLTISGLALGAGILFTAAPSVLAYQGDPNTFGPNYTPERHEAIVNAIKSKNYNAWKSLMDGRGITRRITAQNFNRFAEMVRLRLEGKIDEANKIRAELGLGTRMGAGYGQNQGYRWSAK